MSGSGQRSKGNNIVRNVNLAIIGYVPPPKVKNSGAFLENIQAFKTANELILFSDHAYEGMIKLKGSPEHLKGANYGNSKPNKWALNNALWIVALKIAKQRNLTHFLYIESDCRVFGDKWDATMFGEFLDHGDCLLGGSVVCYNPANKDLDFVLAWRKFVAENRASVFPIPAYGGQGAAEVVEPAVFVNGALAIYDTQFCASICSTESQMQEAARITAFDYHCGRELVRQFGPKAFEKVAHLDSSYSGYGDVLFNEMNRREILLTGKIVAVHQIKSDWQPPKAKPEPEINQLSIDPPMLGVSGIINDYEAWCWNLLAIEPQNKDQIPRTTIFIVTYAKDAEWLKYCLRSINKFTTRFHRVVVVAPSRDGKLMEAICQEHRVFLEVFEEAKAPLGHLDHLVQKCRAYEYDPEADYFLFMDSDTVWNQPVSPADYFVNGKPVLLFEDYKAIAGNPRQKQRLWWKTQTERALKMDVTKEFMTRHPSIYSSRTLRKAVAYGNKLHGSFRDYVLTQKPDRLPGFSEFNYLGAFAFAFENDHYHWIDISNHPDQRPPDKLTQFWSFGGLDTAQTIWRDGKERTVVPREELKAMGL